MFTLVTWAVWSGYTYPNGQATIAQNWPITLTMVFGSFIAGATSEGGGAIAFPVFTKVLAMPPFDAKVFSLAIQSIGMMAATVTITVLRVPVEWRIILWASLGGMVGIVLSAAFIAPILSPALVKMLFTTMAFSFALTLVIINWKQRLYNQVIPQFKWPEKSIIVVTGFLGGMMTGLVGTGIDIICFSVMVMLFRLPEKISTPTSVVLMAINSWVGFALHVFVIGGFTTVVQGYWLAAIPVVVVGAPLGAYICARLSNKIISITLIILILIEFVSSLYLIPLTTDNMTVCLIVFILCVIIYYKMSNSKKYKPHI